ncbi:MAG: InlB B-repeat-containing protein, partial [Firmicutes bacterium]|nr:InlB B-repeat-containing protein [Bacillota bacterium]
VSFDTNVPGLTVNSQTVEYGGLATDPGTLTDPNSPDATFNGWFYMDDEENEYQFDFSTPIKQDYELYAAWLV